MNYNKYRQDLLNRFKEYRRRHFAHRDRLFEERHHHVFKSEYAECNLFNYGLREFLPKERYHRWFRSMGSSQALAVSVFGTMMRHGDLQLLTEVIDDTGRLLVDDFMLDGQPEFEYEIIKLIEPTPTRVDFYLPCPSGNVAIECKLWETELGPGSQVATEKCDGNYAQHVGERSRERCCLTEKGVAY